MEDTKFNLKKRVLNRKTLIAFIIAAVALFFLFRNVDLKATWAIFLKASLVLLLVAFLIHYSSYLIRGWRWGILLKQIGIKVKLAALTEISFLGQFVNCIVPAKLGDIYTGYLVKKNYGETTSKSVGTIIATRILDICVLIVMLVLAALLIFREELPGNVSILLLYGVTLGVLAFLILILFKFKREWVLRLIPKKFENIINNFGEGMKSLSKKIFPEMLILTIILWLMEVARLYFVSLSLGFKISFGLAIFVALAISLLTALPITPSGLGAVEAAVVGILLLAGVDKNLAFSIAIMDRIIGYWSQLAVGAVVYSVSKKV